MKAHDCNLDAPAALPPAPGSAVRPCVSCGAPAVLRNEDGEYCKDCMQIHLLEKMFVQVTKLSRNR